MQCDARVITPFLAQRSGAVYHSQVTATDLTLNQLPERLAESGAELAEPARTIVEDEFQAWRELHDRLIALIAAFLDDAVENGRPIADVLDSVVRRSSIGVTDLLGARIRPETVAALLRAHGSVGTVSSEAGQTTFRHECGTGLKLWRQNPTMPVLDDGEVPGVPGGTTRYCARCIHTISHGFGDAWRVAPPTDPSGHCTWSVATAVS